MGDGGFHRGGALDGIPCCVRESALCKLDARVFGVLGLAENDFEMLLAVRLRCQQNERYTLRADVTFNEKHRRAITIRFSESKEWHVLEYGVSSIPAMDSQVYRRGIPNKCLPIVTKAMCMEARDRVANVFRGKW